MCGEQVHPPGAEDLTFNSAGACPICQGTGLVRTVDDAALIPDPSKTIDDGAVLPWQMFGFNVQPAIAREFGVRTDVPWDELTDDERQIVLTGPEEKKHITVTSRKGLHDLDFTFRNARLTVTEELKRADTEKRLSKVGRFLRQGTCPDCGGTRLNPAARAPRIGALNLAEVTAKTLDDVLAWASRTSSDASPGHAPRWPDAFVDTLIAMARRLVELGLGYLALDRAGRRCPRASGSAPNWPGPSATAPRGALRARRALHRAASGQRRRPARGDARSARSTATRWSSSTTTCRSSARRTG